MPRAQFLKREKAEGEKQCKLCLRLGTETKRVDWLVLRTSIQMKASGLFFFFPTWSFEFINMTQLRFFIASRSSIFSCVDLKTYFCSELILSLLPFLLACFFARGIKKKKIAIFIDVFKAIGYYYATSLKNPNKVKVLFVYF